MEVEALRGGSAAALDAYERWLGKRTIEDPYAVRRVARAVLREAAANDPDRAVRLQAVEALLADGDTGASSLLPAADTAAPSETAARGSTGDRGSVDLLIAQARQPGPIRRVAVPALGRTRDQRAVEPLTEALGDDDPVVRAAAAEALGAVGGTSAAPKLRQLLDDPVFPVHLAAASALLALNDQSGLPWLQQLRASEHATIRLAAARATRALADSDWLTTVRALTGDPDPEVRRGAAELVAPYDPELAKATLEPLLTDANPAERQAAADTYAGHVTTDFAVLRRFLRDQDSGTRVRAADRVLALTR
jgi:HEAT repeat protein